MKVGIIGCGYVFDHYMSTWGRHPSLTIAGVADADKARLNRVITFYKLNSYRSNDELLCDPEIDIVVNLTSIESHFDVTRAALLAGKHVYSEKPLVTDMAQAHALFDLADAKGLRLSCAPCNALSDTSQTMWKAVRDGAVGEVRTVYAEFDDNVIYRMYPEHWRSRSGAPWPYLHEYESGCTYEHVGYHLTWLCSIFGPVESVTAFSKRTLPDKTDRHLDPADTPDFSVACLNFKSGVVARVTCSIGAPYDHRMRIFGSEGILTADSYRHYECPVYLETFNQLSLNARKAISVRRISALQWLFGVGGRKLPLLRLPAPGSGGRRLRAGTKWLTPGEALRALKRRELGQQDKVLGIAELADAIATDRPSFPSHEFTLHLTELTLAIQQAGTASNAYALKTTFTPFGPRPETDLAAIDYSQFKKSSWLQERIDRYIVSMHKH